MSFLGVLEFPATGITQVGGARSADQHRGGPGVSEREQRAASPRPQSSAEFRGPRLGGLQHTIHPWRHKSPCVPQLRHQGGCAGTKSDPQPLELDYFPKPLGDICLYQLVSVKKLYQQPSDKLCFQKTTLHLIVFIWQSIIEISSNNSHHFCRCFKTEREWEDLPLLSSW